ncbi:MAG: hypothetical protein MPK11_05055 [Gammaproteobacteria bacterium]|nr:hypothetical protein [Gammaproteobacteria bacterium]MDA7961922.1 hypothetical protein [Gammaproteobacteria bacterium]MDA7970126.1 hypothetical protein [Gammaproteobacteria bacterium]MDA7995192.1 hypothetical protein [Gammaproteobacteria bacterium]MDA8024501.1 hypothetical protein [Gammaproteobacteria bacterium]
MNGATKLGIDVIWKRIEAHESGDFETKRGEPFTYKISENVLYPSRTDFQLHKNEFEKVLPLLPLSGPGEINELVFGPSYIWAILHDRRIRQNDW